MAGGSGKARLEVVTFELKPVGHGGASLAADSVAGREALT